MPDHQDTVTHSSEAQKESDLIQSLSAEVRDQDEVERNVNRQADQMLNEQAIERDLKRLDKATTERSRLEEQIRKIENRLHFATSRTSATATKLRSEIEHYRAQIKALDQDIQDIEQRIEDAKSGLVEQPAQTTGNQRLPGESQRDFLIRTGKITPFSKVAGPTKLDDNLQEALLNAEDGEQADGERVQASEVAPEAVRSHRVLQRPGFAQSSPSSSPSRSASSNASRDSSVKPNKRRKLTRGGKRVSDQDDGEASRAQAAPQAPESGDSDAFDPGMSDRQLAQLDDSEGEPSEDEFVMDTPATKKRKPRSKAATKIAKGETEDLRGLDDGNEKLYQNRLQRWTKNRSAARRHAKARAAENQTEQRPATPEDDEWLMPHPTIADTEFEGGFKVPGDIFPSLFDYQKTGVQWLWELHSQNVGGIVGDEMGLGKTIQIISFLAGLHHSNMLSKPIIVVCPATVMKQWVNEFHTWWPAFRVSILHTSGSGMMDLGRESKREEEMLNARRGEEPLTKSEIAANEIVDRVVAEGHILVTTYAGLQTYSDLLVPINWGYAVLDEGHKIRNPNAGITLYSKELKTPHRIILSGTPMQNNLIELWSLFDFIFPMRLGNLVDFKGQFEIPIRIGGYANASNLQIQTANKCAETLKDAISPYLLQRMKADVAADLPSKSEKVLFCELTMPQKQAYEAFLNGDDVKSIMNGRRQVLYGVDILRKICNHPDLADHKHLSTREGYNYGTASKSGKMVITMRLLQQWVDDGHKTLLFAQHRIMLDIIEKNIKTMSGINYRRMDGTTPISARQTMVDEFNDNPDAHVFLLTTKVGGLGVNLTGANRVIIFDPDWNPSTDMQARERAWRLGQKREVKIYRLMIAGTIEEKIFHRQLFKQFLTNKILKDPKQRHSFQSQDLHDLFTLGTQHGSSETGQMFEGTETRFDSAHPPPTEIPRDDTAITNLAGVASMRDYLPSTSPPPSSNPSNLNPNPNVQPTDDPNPQKPSDDRIMASLFARSGVTATIEHDKIVNGKRVITADPEMVQREARRVAREAGEKLRKAEVEARRLPAGTVSWTGEFGTAGRPVERGGGIGGRRGVGIGNAGAGRGGGSVGGSLSLLGSVQRRQEEDRAGSSREGAAGRATPNSTRPSAAAARRNARTGEGIPSLAQIRDFIVAHGGKVYTQMILDQFQRRVQTQREVAEFKAALGEVAELSGGRRGRGLWMLKEGYRKRGN